ncbi:MAG TPA: hypothetical protein VKU90_08120 [Caulobacteraceae bacterium]|nr:hypothetical protein [Caulobacteraceae bacterium]
MSETDFRDPAAAKAPAIPRFKTEAVHLPFRSKEAGRPIYEDREFVEILIPGDRRSMPVEPVNDEHKARWPKEYEAFRAGQEAPLEGTPLADWPNSRLTRARAEELAYFNIRTVEHLAAVNDAQLANLGMGARELRQAARTFLDVARTGAGPLERLVAENLTLKDETERLGRDLAQANARLAALTTKETADAGA